MKNKFIPLTVFFIGLTTILQARADVSLMAARVGAEDVLVAAQFYVKAFGLIEVDRLELASGQAELILGFIGDNKQSVANMGPGIAILERKSDADAESMPHIIFRVSDINAVYSKAIKLGGTEVQEPMAINDLGITIAMLRDPAGNTIELLQQL